MIEPTLRREGVYYIVRLDRQDVIKTKYKDDALKAIAAMRIYEPSRRPVR